ncbi:beta-ketoacyl synthase N-terminal-like domain-containing protein [Amycolatopsis sp. A133]|uniref:beta-ketoacyl-[acyl-carrier-protein] synthase family protein n=1 Tax=Amycolatopsis sp. A133 TaxID=3064472 RepID=UPI0027EA7D58|nr:beta-ketoacyl synthase N-terminal-like domain-containing protein [Amycolatopsis sp. A133]MDQ7803472.1 beta-ketoacyl synthase N-terminal-like domain-containing protein [Amycolatopsis sp. A133]
MTVDVVISGFGVLSAFGFGGPALVDGVFSGTPGFRTVTRFDVSGQACDQAATYEPGDPAPTTFDALVTCAEAAVEMARRPDRATLPLIAGTKVRASSLEPEPPAELTEQVARRLGLGTPRRTFVNACCAGANAIIHAAQLVRAGVATTALAGGAFLVDRQAFSLFAANFALATDGRLRPFDQDRTGVLLGDGAAVLVVESAASAAARGAPPLARIAGWAMTDDAHHVAQPKPDGAGTAAAIGQALGRAGVAPAQVTYVNAHGTGTLLNDSAEAAALHTAFGPAVGDVFVSSTKSTTGHALEGSGALEAVITALAVRDATLPPTAGLNRPDREHPLRHVREPRRVAVQYALSLNSSVGGLNTALLLGAA